MGFELPPAIKKLSLDRSDLLGKLPPPAKTTPSSALPAPSWMGSLKLPSQKSVTVSPDLIPAYKPPEPDKSGWGLVMGALQVFDWGRAGVASTLKEGIDLLQGEGFNFGDWREQFDNHYGFGELIHDERQAVGLGLMLMSPFTMGVSAAAGAAVMMDNIWADRIVGTIGDFAIDPLMWMGGLPAFLSRGVGTAPKLISQMAKMGTTTKTFTATGNKAYKAMEAGLKPLAAKQGVTQFTRNDVRNVLEEAMKGVQRGNRKTLSGVGAELGKQGPLGVAMREFLGAKSGLVMRLPMTGAAGRLMRGDKWIEGAGKMIGKSDDWFAKRQLKNIPEGWKYEWAADDLLPMIQAGRAGRRASGAARREGKLVKGFMDDVTNIKDATSVALAAARTPLEIALPSWSRKVGLGGAVLNRVMDLPVRGALAATPKAAQDRLRLMFRPDPIYEVVDPTTNKRVTRNILSEMLKSDNPYDMALAYNFRTDMRWGRQMEKFFEVSEAKASEKVRKTAKLYKIGDAEISDFLDTALDMSPTDPNLALRTGTFYDNLPDSVKRLSDDEYQVMVKELDEWVDVINENTLRAYAGPDGRGRMADEVAEREGMAYRLPRRMLQNAQKRLLEPKFHTIVNEGSIDNYSFKVGGVKQDTLPFDAHGRLTPASLRARPRKIGDFVQIYDDAGVATEGAIGKHLPRGAEGQVDVLLNADGSIFRLQDPKEVGLSFRRQIDDAYERAFGEKAFEGKFMTLKDSYMRGMGRDVRVEHFLKRIKDYYPMVKLDDLLDDIEGVVARWDEAERSFYDTRGKIAYKKEGGKGKKAKRGETIPAKQSVLKFWKDQTKKYGESMAAHSAAVAVKLEKVADLETQIVHALAKIEDISSMLSKKGVDLESILETAGAAPVKTWTKQAPEIVAEVKHASEYVDQIAKLHDAVAELEKEIFDIIRKDIGRQNMPLSRGSLMAERERLVELEAEYRAAVEAQNAAARRIEQIEAQLPDDVKNFEKITRQLRQKEETLPLLEEQAAVLKPLERDFATTDPAVTELAEQLDKSVKRYQNLIDRLEEKLLAVDETTSKGKALVKEWNKLKRSLTTGRDAAAFIEQLTKSQKRRLDQLENLRKQLRELEDRFAFSDEQLAKKFPDVAKRIKEHGEVGQLPPSTEKVPDKVFIAGVKGQKGRHVSLLTPEQEAEWVRLSDLIGSKGKKKPTGLTKEVMEAEALYNKLLKKKSSQTLAYKTRLANARKLKAELEAERARGPFKEGGKPEKRRLERIAGMEHRWKQNNYDEAIDVETARRELVRAQERLSAVQTEKDLIRRAAGQKAKELQKGIPRPEYPSGITGRDTQKLRTLRKRIGKLTQYEKGYGDLADPKVIAAAEEIKKVTDDLEELLEDTVFDMEMVTRTIKHRGTRAGEETVVKEWVDTAGVKRSVEVNKDGTFKFTDTKTRATKSGGPKQGKWTRTTGDAVPLAQLVEAQGKRVALLEAGLQAKIKQAQLQGPLIEIAGGGPTPLPSMARLSGVSQDGSQGVVRVKRTKEVDYYLGEDPDTIRMMEMREELLPRKEQFIELRVRKIGGRWQYANIGEDFGGQLVGPRTLHSEWRDAARKQGWRFYDEGVDPATGRIDVDPKEVTAIEKEIDDLTQLKRLAEEEATEMWNNIQLRKSDIEEIEIGLEEGWKLTDPEMESVLAGRTLEDIKKELSEAEELLPELNQRGKDLGEQLETLTTESQHLGLSKVGRLEGTPYESNAPARLAAEQEDIARLEELRQQKIVEGFAKKDERDELLNFLEQDLPPANVAKNIDEAQATFALNLDTLKNSVEHVREQIRLVNAAAVNVAKSDETVEGLRILSTFLDNLRKGVAGAQGVTSVKRLGVWAKHVEELQKLDDLFAHERFTGGARNADTNLTARQVLERAERNVVRFQEETDDLVERFGLGQTSPFEDVQLTLKQIDELNKLNAQRDDLAKRRSLHLRGAKASKKRVAKAKAKMDTSVIREEAALEKISNLEEQVLRMEQEDLVQATAEWKTSAGVSVDIRARVEEVIDEVEGAAIMRGGTSRKATIGRGAAEFADTLRKSTYLLGNTFSDKTVKTSVKKTRDQAMGMLRDAVSASEWGPWSLMNANEAMNQDVAAVINAFAKINDPVESAWMWQKWDGLQSWLKAGMIATPGFVERNIFGAFFNAWLDGVNLREITNAANLTKQIGQKAVKDQTNFLTAARSLANSKHKNANLYKDVVDLLEAGVRGGGQAVSSVELQYGLSNAWSLELLLGGRIRTGGRMVGAVLNPFNPRFAPFNAVRTVNSWAEDIIRIGVGMDTLRFGGSIDDAVERIAKTQFDYDELTRWERTWARRIIPFYTWTRKNLPYQLEKFLTQPYKYNRLISLKRNLEMGTDTEGVVPDYYMEPFGIRLPIKYKGARVYTAPDFPFQDLFRYAEVTGPISGVKEIGQQIAASTSPIIKTPLEVGFGKQIFTGVPFTGRYQQAPNPITKIEPLMQVLQEVGLAKKNFHGDWKMRDHHIFLVNGLLPTISLIRRAWPNERKYQRNHLRNVVSFLGGVNVNFNTAEVQYNWLQGQKWDEISRRQDMQDLLHRTK